MPDFFADRDARDERRAVVSGQTIALDDVFLLLRVDGFGARLKDKKLARDAVFRPLDVHRLRAPGALRIMFFDETSPLRELQDLKTGETETVALRFDDVSDHRSDAVVVENHFDFLDAELAGDDR